MLFLETSLFRSIEESGFGNFGSQETGFLFSSFRYSLYTAFWFSSGKKENRNVLSCDESCHELKILNYVTSTDPIF